MPNRETPPVHGEAPEGSSADRWAAELQRLRSVYAARWEDTRIRARYSRGNRGNTFNRRELYHELAAAVQRFFGGSLAGLRILDVGCGGGELINTLSLFGAEPDEFYGIDLMPARVAIAEQQHRASHFLVGSAHDLPFPDAHFDLICQFTLMSSILDALLRRVVADEMDRVLRPGGKILWYDFWVNPLNRDTRGINHRELAALFPAYGMHVRQITLAPPLARAAGGRAPILLNALSAFRPLRTHYLAVLSKPSG